MTNPAFQQQLNRLEGLAKSGNVQAQFQLAAALSSHDIEQAVQWMAKAAQQGFAQADMALGVWHTEGVLKSRDMDQGLQYLARAEEKDIIQARHYHAYLLAVGIGMPRDWPKALSIIIALAEGGNAHARRQLELLAAMAGLDFKQDEKGFSGLAEALKEAPVPDLPPRHDFCQKPLIAVFPGFTTPEEADYLIERAKPHMHRSQVIDNVQGSFAQAEYRTSSEMRFLPSLSDLVVYCINERIAKATELPLENQEVLGVLRYGPGQEYKPHHDYLAPDPTGKNPEVERAGQRAKTFLIYLNEDYQGGETEFPRLGLQVRGPKGTGALFTNVARDGSESLLALHAGLPVEEGEKWITTMWIRDKRYTFPLAGD